MAIKLSTGVVTDVPTVGTAIQVGAASSITELAVMSVTVQAASANTNGIWVGDSAVLGSTRRGIRLTPGQAFTVSAEAVGADGEEYILGDLWVDTETNGNDFSFLYIKRR